MANRQQLITEANNLYLTDRNIIRRFASSGLAGIRRESTARLVKLLQGVIGSSVYQPPTIAEDNFEMAEEGPQSTKLRVINRKPSKRFDYEVQARLDQGRTLLRWVLITTQNGRRVPGRTGTIEVHSPTEVLAGIREVVQLGVDTMYVDDVDFFLEAPVAPEVANELPLLERNRVRNCVVDAIIMGTAPATRDDIESKLMANWPNLFQPCGVSREVIESLAKLSGYELKFYSPLARYIPVEPWATFNSSLKNRKIIKMYVDGKHASLELRGACKAIEYATPAQLEEYAQTMDVHARRYDINASSPTLNALVVNKDGELTMIKLESARPSRYTKEVSDDDITYAHLVTPTAVIAELFRRKVGVMSPNASCYQACRRSEKFPRNTLMRAHDMDEEVITIDHNRSFMAYETNPEYVGFPVSRFVAVDGDVEQQGDLRRAYVKVKSFRWTNATAKLIFNATIKDKYPEYMTNVMYNYLKTVAVITIEYSILAQFSKASILEFVQTLDIPDNQRKLISCEIVGMLIRGGVSGEKTHKFVSEPETVSRIRHELEKAKEERVILDYSCSPGAGAETTTDRFGTHVRAELPTTVYVTVPSKEKPNASHIHAYILDYSTTATMKAFRSVYERVPTKVIGICADAIRVTVDAFSSVRDCFDMGDKPGQWKYEHGYLPVIYSHHDPIIDDSPMEWVNEWVEGTSHVFKTLPYSSSRVFISGPGGVGKTHHILQRGSSDLLMLFPTRELRDHFREESGIEARTLAWYIKRCSVGARPKHAVVVVDEVFMFSYERISSFLTYAAGSIVYLMGDPAQIRNSFETPFTVQHLSRSWELVDFRRGAISRHGAEFGQFLDWLRTLKDEQVLSELSKRIKHFEGDYSADDVAIITTHQEAHTVTEACSEYLETRFVDEVRVRGKGLPIKYTGRSKGLNIKGKPMLYAHENWTYEYKEEQIRADGISDAWGEYSELVWYGRRTMKDEVPEGFCYEPCYARTVHSQQGRTISEGRVLLSPSLVKIPGALYTAASRAKRMDQLVWGTI